VTDALIDLMANESGTRTGQPVRIKITQQDLASLIGASRQKTWEALKELEDANVLKLMYGSILVTAPDKLRRGHFPPTRERPVAKVLPLPLNERPAVACHH
jgi:hypothetical protein